MKDINMWIHKKMFPSQYRIIQNYYEWRRATIIAQCYYKLLHPYNSKEDLINLITNVNPIESPWYITSVANHGYLHE